MIQINSFRWGQSNDKNAWQEWGFWNGKNINYRTNTAYVELAKAATTAFSISSSFIPRAITFSGNGGTIPTDVAVFTSNGIYTSAGQQNTTTGIVNIWETNTTKFFITSNQLYSYTTLSSSTLLTTFTRTTETRPLLNFAGDLIIWDGNQVAKWTKTWTLIQFVSGSSTEVIGNLDGTVQALTSIWPDVYVWCQNGTNTNLYIWDWLTASWSQKITYTDKLVQNVALLGNTHYWWQSKTDAAIKEILIGNSYSPQVFVKTAFPEVPLNSNADDEKNKMAICVLNSAYINAIETISDIVYFPWIWRIFWFGKYFPWDKYSFNTEFTFTWTYVNCMASGGLSGSWQDVWWFLAFAVLNWANYDIKIINLWQDGSTPSPTFATSGEIESMEYIASNFAQWEQDIKLIVPFELPSSNCSIKAYYKNNRGSYVLAKTINTTEYWTGYNVSEIPVTGRWRTKQLKFELITTDTAVSPKLYVWITNQTLESWNLR